MTASKGQIIHLIVGLDPGGAEHALLHLVKEQKNQGWHPEVFYLKSAASKLRHRFEDHGIPVHNAMSSPWLMKTLRDRYKQTRDFCSIPIFCTRTAWLALKGFRCPVSLTAPMISTPNERHGKRWPMDLQAAGPGHRHRGCGRKFYQRRRHQRPHRDCKCHP